MRDISCRGSVDEVMMGGSEGRDIDPWFVQVRVELGLRSALLALHASGQLSDPRLDTSDSGFDGCEVVSIVQSSGGHYNSLSSPLVSPSSVRAL